MHVVLLGYVCGCTTQLSFPRFIRAFVSSVINGHLWCVDNLLIASNLALRAWGLAYSGGSVYNIPMQWWRSAGPSLCSKNLLTHWSITCLRPFASGAISGLEACFHLYRLDTWAPQLRRDSPPSLLWRLRASLYTHALFLDRLDASIISLKNTLLFSPDEVGVHIGGYLLRSCWEIHCLRPV